MAADSNKTTTKLVVGGALAATIALAAPHASLADEQASIGPDGTAKPSDQPQVTQVSDSAVADPESDANPATPSAPADAVIDASNPSTTASTSNSSASDQSISNSSGANAPLPISNAESGATPTQNGGSASGASVAEGAPARETVPSVRYDTHVQKIGWQKDVDKRSTWYANGQEAGTDGRGFRVEAIRVILEGAHSGDGISYQSHVQGIGWQKATSDGSVSGTEGKSKRIEALRISLTGDIADAYDIYYCAHVQRYGWLGWAKNGEDAGTEGLGLRLEALRIMLVAKGAAAPTTTSQYGPSMEALLSASAHVQRIGWQRTATEIGSTPIQIGTTGRALRIEALRLSLGSAAGSGSVVCNAHVQGQGWQHDINARNTWRSNSGTTGKGKRVEAVQLSLTGEASQNYDIWYCAHIQGQGWLGWTKNGGEAGSAGKAKRVEALRIVMLPKGSAAPAAVSATKKAPYFADASTFQGVGATVSSSNGSRETIHAKNVLYNGKERTYLFLPSYADLSDVHLDLDSSSAAPSELFMSADANGSFAAMQNGDTINVTGMGCSQDADGAYHLYAKLSARDKAVPLYVMRSAKIGTMHLTSSDPARHGRDWVEGSTNHEAKTTGSLLMVNADGTEVYDGNLTQIKGRGNTTWSQDKKPYQIKLDKKTDLLQTGDKNNRSKTWVLLANSMDPSLLNNRIVYDAAAAFGLDAPDCAPVDLYYDGEYLGSYLLSEKVQVDKGRVEVADLEGEIEDANPGVDLASRPTARAKNRYGYEYQYARNVKDPADITGGYLLELDKTYYSGEICWFDTSVGHVVVKSPEVCSAKCVSYISDQFQNALNALAGKNAVAGAATFDLDSFVKTFLLHEMVNSCDYMSGSMYFYKDAGSNTIISGPVWDFDHANGAPVKGKRNEVEPYTAFRSVIKAPWVINNSTVQARARQLWPELHSLVQNTLLSNGRHAGSGRLHSLAYYYDQIAASARMNRIACPFPVATTDAKLPASYRESYGRLRTWIINRSAWIDTNVSRLKGTVTNRPTVYKGVNYIRVYDYDYYLQQNPGVKKKVGTDPAKVLAYFVEHGMKAGQVASREFNPRYYASAYTDLQRSYGSNWMRYYQHYMNHGISEGRYGAALL